MASIGSLRFLVDTKVESTVILQSQSHRRPRFRLFAYRPRKSLESGGSIGLENGHALVGLCNGVVGSYRRKLRSNEPLRVTSNKGSEEGESGDEPGNKLQSTIEKSKKVLEMQRELLQQIAERKKLVSSIKNSSVDVDEEEASFDQEQGSSSLINTSIASVNDDKSTVPNQSGSILSSTFDDSAAKRKPETFQFASKGGINKRERVENKAVGKDSDKQLENPTIDADALPSFLSVTSRASVQENEKSVDLKESSPEMVNNANDHVTEEVKPPPLAGTNVMNVILVTAECAPWSKTGGLGDVAGSLPKALARRGHRVMVVAPRYGNYAEPNDTGVRKRYKVVGQDLEVTYFQAYIDGVDFVFIDNPIFHHFENNIYGGDRMV